MLWIKAIISIIVAVVVGCKQWENAEYELEESPSSRSWIIVKRVLFFLLITLALTLMIFAAGGGDNNDGPLRRWEEGRG